MSRPLLLCLVVASMALPAAAAETDPVVARSSTEVVRRSELEAEMARVPPTMREEFLRSRKRVGDLVGQMLLRKSLVRRAKAAGIDSRPETRARIDAEVDRVLAQLFVADVDRQAAARFDEKLAQHEARAREIYLVERERFRTPEEVSASHILFDVKKRSSDEARKLAQDARARLVAGADFAALAKEISDDPSAAQNAGALGYFTRDRMDPAFATAAFALRNVGALSEPVLSQFGWHVVRLDGRRESSIPPFEQVRDRIVADLRAKFIEQQRDAMITAIARDPENTIDDPLLEQVTEQLRAAAAADAPAAPAKP